MARKNITKQFEITGFYSAFPFHWNPEFVFHGESHDFWEIVLVTDGAVEVTEDEKVYQLQKNRAVKRQSELVYVFDMMDDDAIINL